MDLKNDSDIKPLFASRIWGFFYISKNNKISCFDDRVLVTIYKNNKNRYNKKK